MTIDKEYYPFKISKNGSDISLLLTDDGFKWDVFEKNGFLGNGHDWTRLIENLLNEKMPESVSALNFDSEADMFCVYSEDQSLLKEISKLVASFYDDEKKLVAHIERYAQYGD